MNVGWLVASGIVGSVGLGLVYYGKKQSKLAPLGIGVVMLAYPYFVSNPWVIAGVGAALVGLMWVLNRRF